MDFPYGETVTILTAGTRADPYSGEETPDWSTPTSVDVGGVAVEPRPLNRDRAGEPVLDARNAVTSGFTLYFPAGTAIASANKVTVRGDTYDVLGEPALWRSPFTGWEPGVVVQVSRTEG